MTTKERACFWLAGFVVFLLSIYFLRSVLLPFAAGVAVAYFLDPVCDRLEGWGCSRSVATTVVTVFFVMVIVLISALLIPLIFDQAESFVQRIPSYMNTLQNRLETGFVDLSTTVSPVVLDKITQGLNDASSQAGKWIAAVIQSLIRGGVAFINVLSLVFITPIVSFYLLQDWDRIIDFFDRYIPRSSLQTVRELAKEVDQTLAGFVRGQGSVCLILGGFYAIGLTLAGLDFGLIVGLVAGLLSFIPYAGAFVGLILSLGLALVQFDQISPIAIVAAVFFIGQTLEGNFLTPKLIGSRVRLHPVWIVFALLAGGSLFAFLGVLLAVPVAAVIGVAVRFLLRNYVQSNLYQSGPQKNLSQENLSQENLSQENLSQENLSQENLPQKGLNAAVVDNVSTNENNEKPGGGKACE